MARKKVLTKKIAEKFLADKDSVDPWEFTTIEDAAAESLSKHEGSLHLNGLRKLSDAAAESLSHHEGELSFYLLASLSDAAAESLSKCEGLRHQKLKMLPASATQILRDAGHG